MIAKRILPLLVSIALSACESTMPMAYVATEVTVSPSFAAPGQTVELRVAATSWGEETIHASNGCAPGLGFSIMRPDQEYINPYPATWPCVTDDSHILEPGETDQVVFHWTAPQITGRYSVVGGVVVDDRAAALYLKISKLPRTIQRMMKTITPMQPHPPVSFFAPYPAATPRRSLLT